MAAFIVEPLVLGAGGMLMYGAGTLAEMKRICEHHRVLFIADEVMTAWGRTGTLFACEQAQVVPDIACYAKGITGGSLPLAVTHRLQSYLGAPAYALVPPHPGHRACFGLVRTMLTASPPGEDEIALDRRRARPAIEPLAARQRPRVAPRRRECTGGLDRRPFILRDDGQEVIETHDAHVGDAEERGGVDRHEHPGRVLLERVVDLAVESRRRRIGDVVVGR